MHYIELTHGFFTLVDEDVYFQFRDLSWHLSGYGYAARTITIDLWGKNRWQQRQQFLHRVIISAPKGTEVDHLNGDKLDNRRANLRLCSRAQNQYNQHKVRGLSKYKGVSRLKGKWRALIQASPGKRLFLGCFGTELEAAQAYDTAAIQHHGEFAKTNKMLGRY